MSVTAESKNQTKVSPNISGHLIQPGDKKFIAFCDLMIGKQEKRETDESLLIVETDAFNADILLDCYKQSQASGNGLALVIKPYLVDLLKRQQSLDAVCSLKELKGNSRKSQVRKELPSDYFSYKHKDLFIALLEVTPSHSHSRLINLCAKLNRPVPFLYRKVLKNGNIGFQLAASGYDELLCRPVDPLLVSYGTTSAIRKGKTNLLVNLFGFSEQSNALSLESSPGGPCHKLSIDMVFDAKLSFEERTITFIVADAHDYNSNSFGFNLVLGILSQAAVCTILHVTSKDFSPEGKPNTELSCILSSCLKVWERPSHLALFWRDYTDEEESLIVNAKSNVSSLFSDSKITAHFYKILNLKEANEVEADALFDDLKNELMTTLQQISTSVHNAMPSIKHITHAMSFSGICFIAEAIDDMQVSIPTNHKEAVLSLGKIIHLFLDQQFENSENVTECLFPASTTVQRIVALEESMRKHARQVSCDHKAIAKLEAESVALKRKKNHCSTSKIVKQFATIISVNGTEGIQEFARQLEAWKKPKCEPLIQERRELQSDYEKKAASRKTATNNEAKELVDDNVAFIKNLIQKNSRRLNSYDISIDHFWSELICLCEVSTQNELGRSVTLLKKECGLSQSQLCTAYTQCVMRGYPIQLLRGNPLHMPSEFMSEVLRSIQVESTRQLFVISVIGAQSSAKSTLLNYLFGCGFATRAGSCTKGLYVSYMQTKDLDLLVLDSEGLMSVESGGRDFDNQVTLMAMACSHIVIINHKGDLSRQLQELLEVALYAMHYLEVTRWRPDVLFALRDHVERDYEALHRQLASMRQSLDENAGKMNFDVNSLLKLDADSLFLLPPAFANEIYCGQEVKLPTVLFSNEVFALRQKIFNAYRTRLERPDDHAGDLLSLEEWLVHARSVWNNIMSFGGNFVHFESLQQIEQRKEIVNTFHKITNDVLESGNGYRAQCETILRSFFIQSQGHSLDNRELLFLDRFCADLDCVTENTKEKAIQLFAEAFKKRPYGLQWKDEFEIRLDSCINEVRSGILRAWHRWVERVKDNARTDEIEKSLMKDMDRFLEEGGSIEAMSTAELQTQFDRIWDDHFKGAKQKLEESLTPPDIQETVVFNRFKHQIDRSAFSDNIFRVLKIDVNHVPSQEALLTSQPLQHYVVYVKHSSGWRVKHKVTHAIPANLPYEAYKAEKKLEAARYLKGEVYAMFRKLRNDILQQSEDLEGPILGSLMKRTNKAIASIGRELESKFDVNLQYTLFANAVYDELKYEALEKLNSKERDEVEEKMRELQDRKEQISQRAMARLHGQQSDIAKAWSVAGSIYSCLIDWARNETLNYSLKAEQSIKSQMPNARAAAVKAFESSFEEEDWEAVVEYCIDANKFLEKLFNKRFGKLEQGIISEDLANMNEYISSKLKRLKSLISKWSEKEKKHFTTLGFLHYASKVFPKQTDERQKFNLPSLGLACELDLLSQIPKDFEIADLKQFANAVVASIENKVKTGKVDEMVVELFKRDLMKVNRELWRKVRGCQEVCPLCNSKCDRDEIHLQLNQKHQCRIHLLPAFHGSRITDGHAPVLDCCTSAAVRKIKWRRKDDPDEEMRTFDKHIKHHWPQWDIPLSKHSLGVALESRLRRAWVNCRKRLIQRYDMKDTTPQEWIELYEQENSLKQ